jgi:hypothetical protein
MKLIGERVSYKVHEDYSTIVISTNIDKWKETILLTWLLGWTICGSVFFYFLFAGDLTREEKLMLLVMCIFWLFFEIRIGKTYLWRKSGMEFIRIDKDLMTIKKSIKGFGKAIPYQLGRIKNVQGLEVNPKGFSKAMNDSFWVIGQGTVRFFYNEKEVRFGSQLGTKDAEKLARAVKKFVREYAQKSSDHLAAVQKKVTEHSADESS